MTWKLRRLFIAAALAVGATLVLSAAAHAADAEDLIREGIEMRRQGRDQDALEKFRKANALTPTPRAQAQMGMAEQALGLWVDAREHMQKALSAAADAWISKNRSILEQSMATIDRHVGSLEVLGSPPGAEVRVEGRLVGTLPLGRQVATAGTAAVDVRAPGYLPATRSVMVTAGELTRETIVLQKLTTALPPAGAPAAGGELPPPPDVPPPSEGGSVWHGRAAWIAAGGAGLFAVGGVAALLARESKAKWFTDPKNGCNSTLPGKGGKACADSYDSGQTMRTLGIASFVTAGVLGAGAVVLFLTRPAPSGEASAKVVSLACAPSLGGIGLLCATTF
jgi:hypothetical protein